MIGGPLWKDLVRKDLGEWTRRKARQCFYAHQLRERAWQTHHHVGNQRSVLQSWLPARFLPCLIDLVLEYHDGWAVVSEDELCQKDALRHVFSRLQVTTRGALLHYRRAPHIGECITVRSAPYRIVRFHADTDTWVLLRLRNQGEYYATTPFILERRNAVWIEQSHAYRLIA